MPAGQAGPPLPPRSYASLLAPPPDTNFIFTGLAGSVRTAGASSVTRRSLTAPSSQLGIFIVFLVYTASAWGPARPRAARTPLCPLMH